MEEQYQPPAATIGTRRTTQYPSKPHRGGVVLALGILGLVVCFICGIVAWIMGNNALLGVGTILS